MITIGLLRTLLSGNATVVAPAPPPDPLEVFSLRFQTHNGDNVPVGLYQDEFCTVPATMDGDPVAAWRDELSGSGATLRQSDIASQPMLYFESGTPTLLFDGVDDYMGMSTELGTETLVVYSGAFRTSGDSNGRLMAAAASATSNDFDTPVGAAVINGNNLISAVRNGNLLSNGFIAFDTWFIVGSVFDGTHHTLRLDGTPSAPAASTGTFAIGAIRIGARTAGTPDSFWTGALTSILLGPALLESEQTTAAEAAISSFHPAP